MALGLCASSPDRFSPRNRPDRMAFIELLTREATDPGCQDITQALSEIGAAAQGFDFKSYIAPPEMEDKAFVSSLRPFFFFFSLLLLPCSLHT